MSRDRDTDPATGDEPAEGAQGTPTPDELRARERAQEEVAREAAADALTPEEERTELRRADKAHYLQERLAEQERADRDAAS